MKKIFVFLVLMFLTACQSQKVFENYDISYSRSGGLAPIYENLLIQGNTARFFFEGHGKKYSKSIHLSDAEKQKFITALETNRLRFIQEDHKKLYDYVTTTIKQKKNNIIKSDGSGIMPANEEEWSNMVAVFEDFIKTKNLRK